MATRRLHGGASCGGTDVTPAQLTGSTFRGGLLPSGAIVTGSRVAVGPPTEQARSAGARSVPDTRTSDLGEGRRVPLWREPSLPPGRRFASAVSGEHAGMHGRRANYAGPAGQLAVRIQGACAVRLPALAAASLAGSLFAGHAPDRAGGQAALSRAMSAGNTVGCSRQGARV
jgi:hypothetical protein